MITKDKLESGRLIGLDVGSKTIGVAFSDLLGLTAQGSHVWKRCGLTRDLAHIIELCEKENVTQIIIGQPKRTDGTLGPEAKKVARFAQTVEQHTGKKVVLWDERFTTKIAEQSLIESGLSREKRRRVIDQVAAALILQNYIDRRGSRA